MKLLRLFAFLILLGPCSVGTSLSQAPTPVSSPSGTSRPLAGAISPTPTPAATPKASFLKSVAHDQKAIWTSPFHLERSDIRWFAPLTVTATALVLSDRETTELVKRNGSLPGISRKISYGGSVYGTAGFSGGLYLIGRATHNEHVEQTGKLALEALIDTAPVIFVLKNSLGRLRPNAVSESGSFFEGGRSFPSGHSSSAWAVATVVAYEYRRRPLIKYGAFAVATAIALSRYTGRNHFLGDVLTGSAIGFGIGRYVYNTHH